MHQKRTLRFAQLIVAVVGLLYVSYGMSHPVRNKARTQRNNVVNAAPRLTFSFSLSNAPSATAELPIQQ